jgi:hypothetical protein
MISVRPMAQVAMAAGAVLEGAGSQAEAAATTKKDVWVCSVCNKKRGSLILCDSCVSRCPMVGILWDIYPTSLQLQDVYITKNWQQGGTYGGTYSRYQ